MMDKNKKILLLPGDGIGPEIMREAEKVLLALSTSLTMRETTIEVQHGLIGGCAYDEYGEPLPKQTLNDAHNCDAILMGAVGSPQYDKLERHLRPESGLLAIRKAMNLFANLRPVKLFPELATASSLKSDIIIGLDILIVRELTGGLYFGQPRGIDKNEAGRRVGRNTLVYSEDEIERIARVAFEFAGKRKHHLCSVDKANVLESSELWRDVVNEVATDYPEVVVSHMYVDNAAMQLVRDPKQFDVIVSSNMFGDILSDLAAMLTGSIGMLPSGSLDENHKGLFEPVHGSAPDIAGTDKANPLALILSLAMLLRYSLDESAAADTIEQAVQYALTQVHTPDLASTSSSLTTLLASTNEVGDIVAEYIAQH